MLVKYIEIDDILSIKKARLEFGDSGLILLDGWNHDDQSANGAGKSSIPNALSYALYDKMPRKISKSEILRRGTKRGSVRVGIMTSDGLLEVVRCRPKNVEFYLDGSLIDITQEEFENRLGMSYDQFLICVYATQLEDKRFISLNDSDKKDFLLRLMNLDRFASKKKEIDNQIKELIGKKIGIEKVIVGCESKLSVYESQLVNVEDIQSQITSLDVSGLEKELKSISATSPDYSKYDDMKRKIREKLSALNEIDVSQRVDRSAYTKLKSEIEVLETGKPYSSSIGCPSCSEDIALTGAGAKKLSDVVRDHYNLVESKKEELKTLVTKINSHVDVRNKIEEINALEAKVNIKIREEQAEYNKNISYANDIRSKISLRRSKIASLQEIADRQADIRSKISEIANIASAATKKLNSVLGEIDVLSSISAILSPTGAPAYVSDGVIDIFNSKVGDYISMVWPNASYRLQAFKENKSGDIKAKFSDKLVIGGKEVSLGSLSGGEYKCLSLSVDFAIIDMVESVFGINMSPIFLDEPFNGLDSSNRERVIDLLDKLSVDKQIWIIDHASEAKSMFSNVVRIEKRGGISDII